MEALPLAGLFYFINEKVNARGGLGVPGLQSLSFE
jgi:hypothetical protein